MTIAERILDVIATYPHQLDYHKIEELCGADTTGELQRLYEADVIFQPYPSAYWDLSSYRPWHEWLAMWRDIGGWVFLCHHVVRNEP